MAGGSLLCLSTARMGKETHLGTLLFATDQPLFSCFSSFSMFLFQFFHSLQQLGTLCWLQFFLKSNDFSMPPQPARLRYHLQQQQQQHDEVIKNSLVNKQTKIKAKQIFNIVVKDKLKQIL